ncbi:MAG TPA: hypothetical protein VMP68_08215 [Candidatus Eisenbacteria bacterium]|nr:hypothetical protein [Candidatus Eisenbacteria bacterium]
MRYLAGEDYKPLPERKDVGRALSAEQELKLFSVASTRREWSVAFWASLLAANTTAGGCEIRNLRLRDIDVAAKTLYVTVGNNKFRLRAIPLNITATCAVEWLLDRARKLGTAAPEQYLIRAGSRDVGTIPRSRRVVGRAWCLAQPNAGVRTRGSQTPRPSPPRDRAAGGIVRGQRADHHVHRGAREPGDAGALQPHSAGSEAPSGRVARSRHNYVTIGKMEALRGTAGGAASRREATRSIGRGDRI